MANLTAANYNPGVQTKAPPVATTTPAACTCPACTGLQCLDRTRYFAGQLLTEADLNNEQSYFLAKNRLHNRFLHGWGVVCGLQVLCGECDGWVTIKTGYAIDPCGNDIIVCQDYSFNVIQAIQACCKPAQTPNCAPLRYTPAPPTCQDNPQTWCITIQYQEQPSRMVTPLQQPNSNGSNGCCTSGAGRSGTSKTSSFSSSSCGCSSSPSQTATAATSAACEPTRIIEGFQIGVLCETPAADQEGPPPGTFLYQFEACYNKLKALALQKPAVNNMAPQQAYQATCNYLASVQNALTTFLTDCKVESILNGISIPQPPSDNSNPYPAVVKRIVECIYLAAVNCLCTALLPTCPADPCDNRLILACVTVSNGKILNICHFGAGRRQVISFPMLSYYLGSLPLWSDVCTALANYCCGETSRTDPIYTVGRTNFTSGGISNPSMIHDLVTSFVADKLGAVLINSTSTTLRTVDLRDLVGQSTDNVSRALASYKISVPLKTEQKDAVAGADAAAKSNLATVTDVSADPAWTDEAVASSKQYAPAAFDITQPLTVFVKGDQVVGFDTTNPTDVLRAQVTDLSNKLAALTTTVGNLSPRNPSAPPSSAPPQAPK